jgi:SAM-dependent methyltransferase
VIELDLGSREDWLRWLADHPEVTDDGAAMDIVNHTRIHGVWEPITGRLHPAERIEWDASNLRESGIAAGINTRNRAVLYALHSCLGDIDRYGTTIYGAEAITDMALLLRGYFPKFVGSEYSSDAGAARDMFPIPIEDLTALSFEAGVFDVAITTEVLEHVPSIDKALSELARILKPGGWHVGTCPFNYMEETSIVRTRVEAGQLIELLPAEYHGDPMGTSGSLVFEIPGWDILRRAKGAGFSRAFWKYVRSCTFGIVSNQVGGILVLCLQK